MCVWSWAGFKMRAAELDLKWGRWWAFLLTYRVTPRKLLGVWKLQFLDLQIYMSQVVEESPEHICVDG